MTTVDTARRPRRGASPTSVSTYALGTYPAFSDDPRCACRGADPNLFFPDPGGQNRTAVAAAKAICRTCPLLDRCREWALGQTWVEGVWGATTLVERKQARTCRTERVRRGVCRHGPDCRRGPR